MNRRAQLKRFTSVSWAFQKPVEGSFGDRPRNMIRGPGTANVDLSMFKDFKTERLHRFNELPLEQSSSFWPAGKRRGQGAAEAE
jgi:hypothetical protein